MRVQRIISIASFILFFVVSKGVAQQQFECSGNPEVCAFVNHFIGAFNERDWKQLRACFADDITVMFDSPSFPERKNGRAAVEAMFRPLFPDSGATQGANRFNLKPENVLIQDLGNVAVVSFHLRQAGEIARRTLILRKNKSSWEIAHIHASSFELPSK